MNLCIHFFKKKKKKKKKPLVKVMYGCTHEYLGDSLITCPFDKMKAIDLPLLACDQIMSL